MNKKVLALLICGFGAMFFASFKTFNVVQEPWKAPIEADTIKSPFTFSPEVIREGEKLFTAYCVSCHGKTGLGDGSPGKFKIEPANFHSKRVVDQTDGALFWKLSNGRGISMPSYKAVFSEEKRWQLIAYIRQFAKQPVAAPTSSTSVIIKDVTNYKFDAGTPGNYFPLPSKVANVTRSETQTFMVDTVVKGLTRPWSMAFLPGNRVLIAQRDGKLMQVKGGQLQSAPIGGNVPKGLRDIKLHPDFSANKLIYLSYYIDPVRPEPGYSVLMRARLEGDKLVDEKILYKAGPFRGNGEWYGSKIALDKQGYLYFTVPIKADRKTAQDLSLPDGKTMRFKDDGSIPADNPFLKTPNALPEIYTFGHRVHEGLAVDAKSGKIYSTEFGELGGDEINMIKRGANYGWPVVSHSLEYNGAVISKSPIQEGIEAPLHHFAIAPSDIEFLYSTRYPRWNGNIFTGALAAKMLQRSVVKNNGVIHDERLLENIGRVRDVKVGPDKFLYVMTEDSGIIVRLIPVKR
ncbi:PQQ-dependent sugar dehydrogenase [Daejeonella lutea]|uniref:Glucose/arabinose dehydrogenase, beta-propeller fold n=1 Tax=Daejeonella lutea TaxID=572036 RepID=A0A1T5C031_9SPHI|nr:PQQ-dependent sugar dehydrogenase [Daejeonella lutea]SKB52735.1 Glucose/arabinose dehydrogenase, beta-propeller fold [Daejeonella lutea]